MPQNNRKKMLRRFPLICFWCGAKLNSIYSAKDPFSATAEHLIPKVDNGGLQSCVLACKECNNNRKDGSFLLSLNQNCFDWSMGYEYHEKFTPIKINTSTVKLKNGFANPTLEFIYGIDGPGPNHD